MTRFGNWEGGACSPDVSERLGYAGQVTPDARDFRLALAAVLRAQLAMAQLNPMDVARTLGIAYQTVRRVFAGDRDPTIHELRRIAAILDTPYEKLIEQADQYLIDQDARQRTIRRRIDEELG